MTYRKMIAIYLIMQMAMLSPLYAQEDEESDVTKYTVREYLEASLPPQEGRKIVLDEITGLLTITDTPKNQKLALQLIQEWDIGPKQIYIEAKFVEITFTDLDEMGIDWQLYEHENPLISLATGMMGNKSATTSETFKQASELAGLGFFAGRATIEGMQLLTYLKALEQSGKVNLLNAPRIMTLSGQMANIQVVRSFPYATGADRTEVELETIAGEVTTKNIYPVETYDIEEEIIGITLEVTPTVIEGSDIITLEIHPEVTKLSQQVDITGSAAFPTDLGWPIIDTRTTQTTVMVRSGGTIILGGLIQDKDVETVERKIPFLGDIPLVGPLFRYKYEKREKKNLVIFLTAKLISARGEEIRR